MENKIAYYHLAFLTIYAGSSTKQFVSACNPCTVYICKMQIPQSQIRKVGKQNLSDLTFALLIRVTWLTNNAPVH